LYLQIDGSYGEGGGQILRTALSLSCISKKPVEMVNIRQGRKIPGLQPQHLTSVNACRTISRASTEGESLRSTVLRFSPGEIAGGSFSFDVGEKKRSAGSTSLVLQALLLPLSCSQNESTVRILGGTHVPWSPPFHYLQQIFAPAVERMGMKVELGIKKWGWYPQGGGEVVCSIHPASMFFPLDLSQRGKLVRLSGISAVSNLPDSIAERQRIQAFKILRAKGFSPEIDLAFAPSIGQGTFFFLKAEFENAVAGFGALGERGKRAETVAQEACDDFFDFTGSDAAVDPHLADQLIPYLAVTSGTSILTVSRITKHLLTNIWVAKQFLKTDISVEGVEGESGKVTIRSY
jgi:RNA 3'-terminal phosphate cyclase (ATP)